jgi:hypothetical protein
MRQEDTATLLTGVRDELGHDVYYFYPDSRHHIPDTVIWGFASACILEFLKGFIDLNRMGKSAREATQELLSRWRSRQEPDPWIQTLNLRDVITEALEQPAAPLSSEDLCKGETALRQALSDFGMDPKVAAEHAKAISSVIERTLCPTR